MKLEVTTYGNPEAQTLLIQMVDDHDLEGIEKEVALIKELSGGRDFCLKAIKVGSWNGDLSPWPAPAVFGNEDFGDGAGETLKFVLEVIDDCVNAGESAGDNALKEDAAGSKKGSKKVFLGGYSLAGLFALWAGYQTDRFAGIAAASPSIWFPGFVDYMCENSIRTGAVYLSLGDREERTRNPVMSKVGDAIREGSDILSNSGVKCTLEWNKGNHFKDAELRTAKGFAWVIQ